jgi:hypothetical protein
VTPNQFKIENIEEKRLQEGIDDVELRAEVRGLRVGDSVKLTFLCGATSFETLVCQITRIERANFWGKLVKKPASSGLAELSAGSLIAFSSDQIHSITNRRHALCEG